jgi:hypothetical protein
MDPLEFLAEEVVILTHEELAPLTVFKTAHPIPTIHLFSIFTGS